MDSQQTHRLLLRQIKDIQAQADQILSGDNSNAILETFSRYSSELREYVYKHVESTEVKAYLVDLPDINYKRTDVKLWQYLILPYWWLLWYKDYQARRKTLEEIRSVRGKYATLELLVKGLIDN